MRKTLSTVLTVALLTALGIIQAHAGNPSSSVDCAFLGDVKVSVNNGSSIEGLLGANADDGRVSIGKKSTAADGSTIIGAAVRLGNSSVVDNVASDSPLRRGRNVTINGSVTGAILPIEDPFCPVPSFECGGPSVVVLRGDAESITPGSYSQIVVEGGGSLTLAAGDYQICSLSAGRKASITVESGAQTTLNIVDDLTLENGSSLTTGLGTVPPQINVLGKRVRLAPNALLQGFVSAPNATGRIGNNASFVGSLCARRITTGRGVSLSCSDVLPTTTSTVPVSTSSTSTTTSTSTTVTSSTIIGSTSSTSSTTSTSTTTTTASPLLDCPCWDDFTQQQLADALNSATPAFPTCSVSATEVRLYDEDDNPLFFAADSPDGTACALVVGNINRAIFLDSAAAAVCLTEATDIAPEITWCGAGTTTSTAQASTTSTSVPETTTSTAAPETTTTTSTSSTTSSSSSTSTSTTIVNPLLECPCWDDFTQQQLADALNSATPAFPTCSVSATEVVLSDADGNPELSAANDSEPSCSLVTGNIDRNLVLDSAAAAVCLTEATDIAPEVEWCNDGTTTSTAQASTTSTSVPETTTSTAAPETTTTTSSSTTSSSIETTTTTFSSTSTSTVPSTSSTTVSTSSTSSTTVSTSSTTSTSSSTSSTSTSNSSTSTTSTSTSSSTSSTSTSSSTSSTSTSTTTSSSSSSSSSSTSTTPASTTTTTTGPPTILDFTTTIGTGTCGRTYSNTAGTAGALLTTLTCGGLKLGAGQSFVGENITPDGSTNRMGLVCNGNSCLITPQSQVTADYDCSVTGCRFGAPLPLSAGGISSCILNTFTQNVGGSLNLSTGVASMNVVLNSRTYVTGNNNFPCPVCLNQPGGTPLNGTPANPLTGVCSRGPNAGQACTTRNSRGLTNDCQPDGTIAGDIPVNLSPLTTGSRVQNEQDRLFCPLQENFGCFAGGTNCRRIVVDGQAAGALTLNQPSNVRLASIFCVEETNNPTVNVSTDLPGPGATSLVGTFTTRNN